MDMYKEDTIRRRRRIFEVYKEFNAEKKIEN